MSEDKEPDWLAELTASAEALRRQVEQLSRAAEQFVRDARRADTSGGPVPPFQQRMVRAVGAAIRELVPIAGYPVRGSFKGYAISSAGTMAGIGGFAMPPVTVVAEDVITVTETASVEVVPDRPSGLAGLSPGQILAIALIWVVAYALPIYLYSQSPTPSTLIEGDLATVALAYEITCRILDKRK
jgi:hypothetical protein